MRFPADAQLHLLCARKEQNHRFPCVTLRDGWLYATDNRVLAAIRASEVEGEATDVLNIEPDALKEARKRTRKGERATLKITDCGNVYIPDGPSWGVHTGAPVPAPPDIDSLELCPTQEIGFSGKFLGELARALGCDQLYMFFAEGLILVRCVDDDGKLMKDRYGLVHPVEPRE